jgi:hypothetical protein
MTLVSIVASFALSIILMFYNVHLLGGYFYILPRMAYGFLGFALFFYTYFEFHNSYIYDGGSQ